MEIRLGTVQFGLAYGVAGRSSPVPVEEVVRILDTAAAAGVRRLDTAPGYGDIEARLAGFGLDGRFRVTTKIPAVGPVSATEAASAVEASLVRSRQRLGGALDAVLFHDAGDLLGPQGDVLWRAAAEVVGPAIRLGVSAYSPDVLRAVCTRYPIALAQLPGNALDHRWADVSGEADFSGVEVELRSIFLQGALLLPAAIAAARVPEGIRAFERWEAWVIETGLSRVAGAVSAVAAMPRVAAAVVGVDSAAQLAEILTAASAAVPRSSTGLRTEDARVIDPRQWRQV